MKNIICLLSVILYGTCCITAVTAQTDDPYWQQEVNHRISVTLDDATHFLNGQITLEYINHSPDTLQFIWFHLWPNAYKNTSTAFAIQELENGNTEFEYAAEADRGFISELDFRSGGAPLITSAHPAYDDVIQVLLNQPLMPGNSILISTPFRVKIPKTFSRLGHTGQSYQVTQWYPKPAVYDRFGWHPMPYLDQGEFYSEFGSFDVTITLPRNYVVGATGSLMNPDEIAWLDSIAAATTKKFATADMSDDNLFSMAKRMNDDEANFPLSATETKTLRYVAEHVHDFAWFADKRYQVMKSAVTLPGKTTPVTTWTMFLNRNSQQWKNAIRFVDSAVIRYSEWVGNYPYPQATAVEGGLQAGDGMEYPMITVISGGFGSNKTLETVVAHEVGHNWFYGILAFNERLHPWMDEGINSYYENRYIGSRYPDDGLIAGHNPLERAFDLSTYPHGYLNYLLYTFQAYRLLDQPMDMNAADFTSLNYGSIVYAKSALVFKYLESWLGTEQYDSLMRQFYLTWAFRHPYPEDLKHHFETATRQNLDWFFEQTIETNDYLDYKLVRSDHSADAGHASFQKLLIANKAQVTGPLSIAAFKDGRQVHEIWFSGFDGEKEVLFTSGDYDEFRIDANSHLPELNRKNNSVKTKGLFPHLEKFRFQWLGSLDNPQRTQLFFTPAVAWNNYDKVWLGLALYNSVLPSKPLSFILMPSYGFGSKRLVGLGEANLQLFPAGSFIQRLDITSSAKSYHYANDAYFGSEGDPPYRFIKFTQQLQLTLRKKEARSTVSQWITFRNIYLMQEVPEGYYSEENYTNRVVNQLTYLIQQKRVLNPCSFSATMEQGNEESENFYLKTSLEGHYTITYPRKKSGIDLRMFAGFMLVSSGTTHHADFHLASITGSRDYRFDEVYLGRTASTGFLSQQVAIADGGFKVRTDGVQPELGASDTWLFALNLRAPLPFFSPFFVFADVGFAPGAGYYRDFQYDAGAGFTLIPGIAEVFLPFVFSGDMKQNLNTTPYYDSWYKRISFVLNINKMHPIKAIRNFTM